MAKTRLLHAALVLENNSILTVKLNNFQPFFWGVFFFFQIVLHLCITVCACGYVAGQYTLFLSLTAVLKFLNWE